MKKVGAWWSGVVQSVIGAGIWSGIIYVLSLLVSAAGGAALAAAVVNRFSLTAWPYISASFIGFAILFTLVAQRLFRRGPRIPNFSSDIEVVKKEIEMRYESIHHMKYTKKLRLRALRDNIDRHLDKYLWTGDHAEVVSAIPQHGIFLTKRRNIWQHYEVLFNRKLMSGQEIDIHLVWSLSDEEEQSVPFISSTVEAPTKQLSFCLQTPPEWGIGSVDCEVSLGIGAVTVLSSESKTVMPNGTVEWVIDNPKQLYHYEMRWDLDNARKTWQ